MCSFVRARPKQAMQRGKCCVRRCCDGYDYSASTAIAPADGGIPSSFPAVAAASTIADRGIALLSQGAGPRCGSLSVSAVFGAGFGGTDLPRSTICVFFAATARSHSCEPAQSLHASDHYDSLAHPLLPGGGRRCGRILAAAWQVGIVGSGPCDDGLRGGVAA